MSRVVLLLGALLWATGCATFTLGPMTLAQTNVIGTQQRTVRSVAPAAELQTERGRFVVYAVQQCELRSEETRTLETVYRQPRDVAGTDPRPWLLVASAAGAALGAYLYFDADSIAARNKQAAIEKGETQYSGAQATRLAGGFFAALSAVGLTVVFADTVRAHSDETTRRVSEQRSLGTRALGYCGESALRHAHVTATRSDGSVLALGDTDDEGALSLDAAELRAMLEGDAAEIRVERVLAGAITK